MKTDIGASFRQISATPDALHAASIGTMAYTVRPNNRRTNEFRNKRCALEQLSLVVQRPQWRAHKNKPVKSIVTSVYLLQCNSLTGRIEIDASADADINPIAWDVAIPRSARINASHILCPEKNRTGAQAAITLHQAILGRTKFGHPAEHTPVFPDVLFVFNESNPPKMERTASLLAAVRTLRPELAEAPDDVITDEDCRATFRSLLVHEGGKIYAPQWLFGRELGVVYETHPRNDYPRPTADAPEWTQVAEWVMIDGSWIPKAQEPMEVVVDLTSLVGRESFAAWEILVESGHLPAMSHAEWAEACSDEAWAKFREDELTKLFVFDGNPNPMIEEWRRRNAVMNRLDDDDIIALAFEDVRKPYVFEDEAKVGVVDLQGYPSPESMTFMYYGFFADLFSVKPIWASRLEPISPSDVDRLHRGLPIVYRRNRDRGRQHTRRS